MLGGVTDVVYMTRVDCMTRISRRHRLIYAGIPASPNHLSGRGESLSPASGFEHPASTLPTRFPAALGIEHDLPAA